MSVPPYRHQLQIVLVLELLVRAAPTSPSPQKRKRRSREAHSLDPSVRLEYLVDRLALDQTIRGLGDGLLDLTGDDVIKEKELDSVQRFWLQVVDSVCV
jgi:hypothetical protein